MLYFVDFVVPVVVDVGSVRGRAVADLTEV